METVKETIINMAIGLDEIYDNLTGGKFNEKASMLDKINEMVKITDEVRAESNRFNDGLSFVDAGLDSIYFNVTGFGFDGENLSLFAKTAKIDKITFNEKALRDKLRESRSQRSYFSKEQLAEIERDFNAHCKKMGWDYENNN